MEKQTKYYWTSFQGVVLHKEVPRPVTGNICIQSELPFFHAPTFQAFICQEQKLVVTTILFWIEISKEHYDYHFNMDAQQAMRKTS